MRRLIIIFLFLAVFGGTDLTLAKDIKVAKPRDIISFIANSQSELVLVNFWASWCPPCRMEIPSLIKLRTIFPRQKLSILGVSVDYDPEMFFAFYKETNFNYPVWLGKESVGDFFQVVNLPKLEIYRSSGEKVFIHEGYMGLEELKIKIEELLGE
ncbi:MAG: hypothetical protein PWR24_170 [Desulfonauticus sp.]|jgi:thiol-disulfide isomerase/thioredoxin|nr:hypothetical protein [Desulfonauticus sp.]